MTNPDLFIPWPNIGSPASARYDANAADYARVMLQDASVIQAMGIQNPIAGLYSATSAKLAAGIDQTMADGLNDIVLGRREVSALDHLVKDLEHLHSTSRLCAASLGARMAAAPSGPNSRPRCKQAVLERIGRAHETQMRSHES